MSSYPLPDKTTVVGPSTTVAAPGPNAALRGAVSAFSRPSSSRPALAVAPQAGSNARTAAFKAANRTSGKNSSSFEEQTHTPPTWLSSAQLQHPGPVPSPWVNKSRGSSPSNVAAALAVKKLQATTPTPTNNAPTIRARPGKPFASHDQPAEDVLPSTGTVLEVKKWLQTLEDPRIEEKAVAKDSGVVVNGMERLDDSRKGDETPQSPSDSPILTVKAHSPIVHSPKPQRVLSTANALGDDQIDSVNADHVNTSSQPVKVATGPLKSMIPSANVSDAASIKTATKGRKITAASDIVSNLPQDIKKPRHTSPQRPKREASASSFRRLDREASLGSSSFDPDATITVPKSAQLNRNTPFEKSSVDLRSRRPSEGSKATMAASDDSTFRQVNSLADAIVASHLASSRSSSPFKTPTVPGQQRQTETLHAPFHASKRYHNTSRTPSPSKGRLQYSMRDDPSSSDEDGKPRRRHRKVFGFRKHPHKHHEGDRKRWRDRITELERKRYEGVWAANRGLYAVPTTAESSDKLSADFVRNGVSNIVARDIWMRSKLPEQTLEEIWDLVDRNGRGILDREEFVVGLWLIDQRLKGRKLPLKIGDSVWLSIHGIQGVTIPKHHWA